jgi:hypothetical protein
MLEMRPDCENAAAICPRMSMAPSSARSNAPFARAAPTSSTKSAPIAAATFDRPLREGAMLAKFPAIDGAKA